MKENNHISIQLQLVDAIKSNDQNILKSLYQNNYKKVELHILKNSGSIAEAKDVFQEAFLAMYQNVKADKFTPETETALQGYLFTIARNKWRDVLRSSRFKKTSTIDDTRHEAEDDFESNAFAETEQQHQLSLTMEAFKKLGEECRTLLKQFYFENKSMRDISTQNNLAEASTRNKKYRCIQKLKELALSPN
ncbi:RNA polymerase sigma factor [Patiriisocius marinistellae]|uniref:RNA polymerase sigma factor n=1 Tax=Patiriisocius marinistellae TaxID=2494560 RepID=A0A5J4FVW9_9FLAO|nr:sigma-70 family RNA polymerase sigma factor [Patiriisocius marinistellae]GEQ85304.1 RNA polymerase sigma factor [Patiriisocius marinistellae]